MAEIRKKEFYSYLIDICNNYTGCIKPLFPQNATIRPHFREYCPESDKYVCKAFRNLIQLSFLLRCQFSVRELPEYEHGGIACVLILGKKIVGAHGGIRRLIHIRIVGISLQIHIADSTNFADCVQIQFFHFIHDG